MKGDKKTTQNLRYMLYSLLEDSTTERRICAVFERLRFEETLV